MQFRTQHIISFTIACSIVALSPSTGHAWRIVPPAVAKSLSMGLAQNLIIHFDGREVESKADSLRRDSGVAFDDEAILDLRRRLHRSIRQSAASNMSAGEYEELREYDQLPFSLIRVRSRAALDRLLSNPLVKGVYEDGLMYPQLLSSLPFIGQPATVAAGYTGAGTTVAVIDTGINYINVTYPDLGSCSSPGSAGCRVAAVIDCSAASGGNYRNCSTSSSNTDTNGHGTNVAGIVAGVAPATNIAAINVFTGASATDSAILAGINWAINNRTAHNIVAINMSLGDNARYTAPCSDSASPDNPRVSYTDAVLAARNAGIITVAASGNNAYSDGISSPACTPGVVSVGSVYDSNIGGWNYGSPITCTDSSSSADKIVCSSNSASFLTMLAPGAQVTAAGSTMFGTSQASPHVAGAVAVLREAYPAEALDQTVNRMTTAGVPITDTRNGVTTPRLNLLAAADTTAPVVSLTEPTSGATVSGAVTVTASASDNVGVSRVDFYLNGIIASSGTVPPFGFIWDTTTVSEGSYSMWALAFDTAGNQGQSETVTVTVSNPLPVPGLSAWGMLAAALGLAGIAGKHPAKPKTSSQ